MLLTITIATLAFLAFGYLSLLRILYRQQFSTSYGALFTGLSVREVLGNIGNSAFFVGLPATSLLLFWGWGPALLWLLIFHILVESLLNLQLNSVDHPVVFSKYLSPARNTSKAFLMNCFLQSYLILLLSVVVTLMAELVNKESGQLFVLVMLIPVGQLLYNSGNLIPNFCKRIGALVMLLLALLFAHKFGIAITGDWSPLHGPFGWLKFNNTTIMAAIMLIGGVTLANGIHSAQGVAKLGGAAIVTTIILLTTRLIWLNPSVDAPMNSANFQTGVETMVPPPSYIGLCLFIFAGLTSLLFRLFYSITSTQGQLSRPAHFGQLQIESLAQLVVLCLLVICLASSTVNGTWASHYLDWQMQINLVDQLNLAINSISNVFLLGSTTDSYINTLVVTMICITGLSFLQLCIRGFSLTQKSIEQQADQAESFLHLVVRSKALQITAAFIVSCYFIDSGISINTWLLIGMLSWLVVTQLITAMTLSMVQPSTTRLVFGGQSLILIGLGSLQIIWISFDWLSHKYFLHAVLGSTIVIFGGCLWASSIRELMARFSTADDKTLFG